MRRGYGEREVKLILRRVVELQYLGDDRLRALTGSGSVETEQPRSAVLEIARQLTPRIREAQDRIDEERELPKALADEIKQAGLFRLLVPRSLGGSELAFPSYLCVIEEIAAADGSAGWCVNQAAVFATRSAFMAKEAAREIWGNERGVVANGPPPGGEAVEVEGGYRLNGRWTFSSGCRHATWLAGIAAVQENGERRQLPDGRPDVRFMLLPKDDAEIIDTWDVRGLRGTGSHHFSVDDLFVPAARAPSIWEPAVESGVLYVMPMNLLFACGFAAVALGVARSALDTMLEMCGTKKPRGVRKRLRDQDTVQRQVGQAETIWHCARAFLHASVREVWDSVSVSRAISMKERIRMRMAGTHTIRLAAQSVDIAYEVAGSDAIFLSNPLQRRFQDIHVIIQHVQGRSAHYDSIGRFTLGLDPDPLSV